MNGILNLSFSLQFVCEFAEDLFIYDFKLPHFVLSMCQVFKAAAWDYKSFLKSFSHLVDLS